MSSKAVVTVRTIIAVFAFVGFAMTSAECQAHNVSVPLPPMGWSSWNSFSNTIDAQIVVKQAEALIANGMKRAGYQYVNIDEGWWLGQRDADGNIVVDEKAWPALGPGEKPGDMSNIVRFIHSLGLKAGIYTDAGKDGCSIYPDIGPKYFHTGSEGHYQQDFLQFAQWGFDYVKVDWCGGDEENLDPAVQYAAIAHAIARAEQITGHQIFFSLCEWGKQSPWTWAPNVGGVAADIWRTSADIVNPIVADGPHAERKADFNKMILNFENGIHPEAQHTGFYNDPDMMVLGMPGFNDVENRVHMSLWAISGAPLLVGADLAQLSPQALGILINPAVLAIDQDPLGLQATKVSEPTKGLQVWSKDLAQRGARAVLLLNNTAEAREIEVRWSDLGLTDASANVKNLWSGEKSSASTKYRAEVSPGDGVLLRVQGTELSSTTYHPVATNETPLCSTCELRFPKVASHMQWARVDIIYANSAAVPVFATLSVNDQYPMRIAFPPTGSVQGIITIQAILNRPGAQNELTFSAAAGPGPVISTITVQ